MGETIASMAQLRPIERLEQLDSLWSWIERFGVIKALLATIFGAATTTWLVSLFQSFPRWIFLSFVFIVAALVILAGIAFCLWLVDRIKKQIKSWMDKPLQTRIIALEQSLGPRRLTQEQRTTLQEKLAKTPGRIRIGCIDRDDDAKRLAEDFVEVLKEARWDIWGIDEIYESRDIFRLYGDIGLFLYVNSPPIETYKPAQSLADTLGTFGIKVHYYISYEIHHDCCELIVGHRGDTTS